MSMTIQEAITELSGLIGVYDDIYDYEAKELWPAFELAVEALREKAEREDPKPLTEGGIKADDWGAGLDGWSIKQRWNMVRLGYHREFG